MKRVLLAIALLLNGTLAVGEAVMVKCHVHVETFNHLTQTITEKLAFLEITFDASAQRVVKFTSYLLPACTDLGVKTDVCKCNVIPDRIVCEGQGAFTGPILRRTQGNFTIDRMSGKITGGVRNQLTSGLEEFFFDGQCGVPGHIKF